MLRRVEEGGGGVRKLAFRTQCTNAGVFFLGSSHGELAKPARRKALKKSLGIKDQSNAIVPQGAAVADTIRTQ